MHVSAEKYSPIRTLGYMADPFSIVFLISQLFAREPLPIRMYQFFLFCKKYVSFTDNSFSHQNKKTALLVESASGQQLKNSFCSCNIGLN